MTTNRSILFLVFITLLIDLFAFTVILPIFPSLIIEYQKLESPLLNETLNIVRWFRLNILNLKVVDSSLESTLLGGMIGSLFSILQFIVSPYIGKWADIYGRKKVLLISVLGNLISSIIWFISYNFPLFLIARIIAGLSEGNVQLANTIIADVTDEKDRSKGMALVGLAFSIAFTIGPTLSGYFVSKQMFYNEYLADWKYTHKFSSAALLACVFIIIEWILIYFYLPETQHYKKENKKEVKEKQNSQPQIKEEDNTYKLKLVHLFFLFIFSGVEFTIPFLAQKLYNFGYMEQGRMFGYLGILSALIQGGYVRRYKTSEKNNVVLGIVSCMLSLLTLVCILYFNLNLSYLYLALTLLSITSATVVSCLSSWISKLNNLNQGTILGEFRSYGQLGRACGPILTCTLYWAINPINCYLISAMVLILVLIYLNTIKVDKIIKLN